MRQVSEMTRLFIWDYHGVLEQGNETALMAISNRALQECGYSQRLADADMKLLYGKSWLTFFSDTLPTETPETHKRLLDTALRIDKAHPEIRKQHIKATPFAHGVLVAIRETHKQVLISNCHDISVFLRLTHMERDFPKGHHYSTHATTPPRGKQEILDAYLRALNTTFERAILIGDSPDDVALKAPCCRETVRYLYAHPGVPFRECEAEHKIRDLKQILQEL